MMKICKPKYLAKVKLLTKEETERLLSRMGGKLDRRLEKRKVSQEEALAMQLELEDEQLQEWRKMMHSLKNKEEAKKEAKAKVAEKAKAPLKAKVAEKAKVGPGK
jgi:N-acyl-L-homoserine lactone synthetase